MQKNEFIFPLKVYIEDTDYGGVVYHSNYLKYYERARTEWATALGIGLPWQQDQGIYFVVRSAHLEYLKPARLDEKLEVVTRLKTLKHTSAVFEQHLRIKAAPATILNQAEIGIVCINTAFRPQAIPPCQLHEIIAGEAT